MKGAWKERGEGRLNRKGLKVCYARVLTSHKKCKHEVLRMCTNKINNEVHTRMYKNTNHCFSKASLLLTWWEH